MFPRNLVVVPFGLKSDGLRDARGAAQRVDIFPVLEQTDNRIVLGLNDRHLDFRIIVQSVLANTAINKKY